MKYDPATDATLLQTGTDSSPTANESEGRSIPEGYELGELLGRGGMGEVVLATDSQIGRQVAIKRIRGDFGESAEARFLREAQIQARLDHPAIVPVHQIGRDREGRPFFTMKRLTGTTLAETIHAGAAQQRLLNAFVDVCRAIDFAHARGIVHRDLKPSNIMLGDYGEVYVIDWGLARVLDEADQAPLPAVPTASGQTEVGAMLGTPGYMSPEQAHGETVGTPTDVYALGSILYEILAREPLHPRGIAAISSTLTRPTAAPSSKRPDIPPELDAVTQAALAAVPDERPTARVLAERIQNYLDGDRDLERRRVLAAEQLAIARTAFDADDRGVAMQSAGRALALDPESRDAAQILTSLTLEPPAKNPPELEAHLAAQDLVAARRQWKQVAAAWVSYFFALPLLLIAGVRNPTTLVTFYVLVAACWGYATYWSRRGKPILMVSMLSSIAVMVVLSRLFGPHILVPAVLAVMVSGFVAYPSHIRKPIAPIAIVVAGYLLILVLEWTGVLAPTWDTAGNTIVTTSALVDLSGPAGKALIIVSNVVALLAAALLARSIAASRYEANRKLEIQAWHLRKLVPA